MHGAAEARLRAAAETILRAGIAGAMPGPGVAAALARAPELADAERVLLLAYGKAAPAMATAAVTMLGDRIAAGLVVAPHGTQATSLPHVRFLTAAHPLPDRHSVAAARAARTLLDSAAAGDVVLALLSGGASALLAEPAPGLSLDELVTTTRALLHAGADIHELNRVRRRIDLAKGGRFADYAAPARVLCLAVSDVPGDDPAIIGSGPFTPDGPQPGHVRYEIIASNANARAAAEAAARTLGYQAAPAPFALSGEARRCGDELARVARAAPPRNAIVFGGETTVIVRGRGSGGRNQELALAAALSVAGEAGIAVGSIGTDGIDGNSPAAGAIVTGATAARIRAAGIDADAALADNDSYAALASADAVLVTGATGTNVMDLAVVLRG